MILKIDGLGTVSGDETMFHNLMNLYIDASETYDSLGYYNMKRRALNNAKEIEIILKQRGYYHDKE